MKTLLRLVCFALVCVATQSSDAAQMTLWYNGDPDLINGLANELNTYVSDARVYEDFDVPTPLTVCAVYSNNWMDFYASSATWEIRSGVGPGTGGTLVASGSAIPTQTPNGFDVYGYTGFTIMVAGLNVDLSPGTYWLNVRPADSGVGRSFVQTTSGANGVGSPIQNNNSIIDSDFFGFSWQPSTSAGFENQPDFSMGVLTVPEPSSLAILSIGGGLLGLNLARRRRMR